MYHRRSSAEELRKDEAGREWTLQLISIEPPQTITFCVDPSLQTKKHVRHHTGCLANLMFCKFVCFLWGCFTPFTGHGAVDFLPKGSGKLRKELCESAMKGKTWDADRIHLTSWDGGQNPLRTIRDEQNPMDALMRSGFCPSTVDD